MFLFLKQSFSHFKALTSFFNQSSFSILNQKHSLHAVQLFQKALQEKIQPRNQNIKRQEQLMRMYLSVHEVIPFTDQIKLTFLKRINFLFDNKIHGFNPMDQFYFQYQSLVADLMSRMNKLSLYDFASLLFVATRFKFSDMFEYVFKICQKVQSHLHQFSDVNLKSVIYSFSKFGITSKRLKDFLIQKLLKDYKVMDDQLIFNLVLYLGQCRLVDKSFFTDNSFIDQQLLQRQIKNPKNQFYKKRLISLFIRIHYLESKYTLAYINDPALLFARKLLDFTLQSYHRSDTFNYKRIKSLIRGSLQSDKGNKQTFDQYQRSWQSLRHQKLLSLLKNLVGPDQKINKEVNIAVFSIDIYLPDLNLLVQIDGPTHFIRQVSQNQLKIYHNLNSNFRQNSLKILGYNVISINNFSPDCSYLDELKSIVYRLQQERKGIRKQNNK